MHWDRVSGDSLRRGEVQRKRIGQNIHSTARCWRLIIAVLLCGSCAWPMAGPAEAAPSGPPSTYRFVRFGAEQGLSSIINDLDVDRQGYVWVATSDGLARYDGTKFRFWRRESGVDSSLPDNNVHVIALDDDDLLWIASPDHLSMMDGSRRDFMRIPFEGDAATCGDEIQGVSAAVGGRCMGRLVQGLAVSRHAQLFPCGCCMAARYPAISVNTDKQKKRMTFVCD